MTAWRFYVSVHCDRSCRVYESVHCDRSYVVYLVGCDGMLLGAVGRSADRPNSWTARTRDACTRAGFDSRYRAADWLELRPLSGVVRRGNGDAA